MQKIRANKTTDEVVEKSEVEETEQEITSEVKKEVEESKKLEETTEVVEVSETEAEVVNVEETSLLSEESNKVEQKEEVVATDEKIEDVDYSELTQEELVDHLKKLLDKHNVIKVKDRIESIKVYFYKRHHAEIDEKKKAFVENGGLEEEFTPVSNPVEEQFKAYYAVYKEKRASHNVNLEKQKSDNLSLKYQIIDKIGELITGKESLNKTFHDFKDLQKQWQEIGLVPQAEVKKLSPA